MSRQLLLLLLSLCLLMKGGRDELYIQSTISIPKSIMKRKTLMITLLISFEVERGTYKMKYIFTTILIYKYDLYLITKC